MLGSLTTQSACNRTRFGQYLTHPKTVDDVIASWPLGNFLNSLVMQQIREFPSVLPEIV